MKAVSDTARQQCLLGDLQHIIHPSVCESPSTVSLPFHPTGPLTPVSASALFLLALLTVSPFSGYRECTMQKGFAHSGKFRLHNILCFATTAFKKR